MQKPQEFDDMQNLQKQYYFKPIKIDYHLNESSSLCYKVNTFDPTLIEKTKYDNHQYNTIEILKLHGSINFPKDNQRIKDIQQVIENPLILPPIFNKMGSETPTNIWKRALEVLKNAHRINIVGYSMPKTDIYMQYFLKTAIGANINNVKINVFDPIIYKRNSETEQMKQRYYDCFAPQMLKNIFFEHPLSSEMHYTENCDWHGTTKHFVQLLEIEEYSKKLFF